MNRWNGCGISVTLAILIALAGCGKQGDDATQKNAGPVPAEIKKDNAGKPVQARATALTKAPKLLPFNEAVILDPPPEGEQRPANKTHTGKNAIKIFESIANELWDKVKLTDNDGKNIRYRAVIATELGNVHVDLFGDAAPNHVRSFICLAKTGYYDGMAFYRSVNRQVEDGRVAYIETGCPRGTGEAGSGSIGYWLRPEISDQFVHEEGTVGASIGEDPDSASCRFHILAGSIPAMNGRFTVFGKVTQGLDIVRTINKRAVNEFDRLDQPVLIRSVTIQSALD